jgi:hypothetical protein
MREAVDIARAENKTSAELKRILAQFVLMMTSGASPLARLHVIPAKKVQQVCITKFRNSIGFPLLVDQQRKGDARFFTKQPRVVAVPQSDGRQSGSLVTKRLFVFAQLRDVLAAKNSSIVTQKNDHGRLTGPQ